MNGTYHCLNIDIETYSDVDIKTAGLYKYAQSPAFEVLLFGYSLNGGPRIVVDLTTGETIHPIVLDLLRNPSCLKLAYNAAFEWYCLSRHLQMSDAETAAWISQWRCTQLHGLYCGYPAGLEAAGKALGLPQDKQKMAAGKALIKYFCVPCTPTKTNGGRTRNLPHHDPDKWTLFKEYNAQDVVTEMEIGERLSGFPVPAAVQKQWETDQLINLRGVAVDIELVEGALDLDAAARADYLKEAVEISGLNNPNSVGQLAKWIQEETGEEVENLRKDTVSELLGKDLPSSAARRMLEIRKELGKTSNKKYNALEVAVCADRRVRGLLQFYGANRTGRWAGRIVQPQNLPRTYIDGDLLPLARQLVESRNRNALQMIFGSVPDTLSQLIRTALVAAPGRILVDADFSAIEARVIAWLANEEWVLEVFRTHGKIYEATASQLYGVPIERIKKGNEEYSLRQYGKAATLALGYQGGSSALITAGHLPKDTPEDELLDIRDRWRRSNPAIVRFWYTLDAAARETVDTGRSIPLLDGRLVLARESDPAHEQDFLTIQLPNGRKLFYAKPHMSTNRFGQPSIGYWGMDQKSKKWSRLETYGGKLAENITQAVARDCLAEAIDRLEAAGYPVVFHVHDEVVIEAPPEKAQLEEVVKIMSQVPAWAQGLPLNAEGWTNEFFKKD